MMQQVQVRILIVGGNIRPMNELSVIQNFLTDIKCGDCGQHCDPANFRVLGHQEDLWCFTAHCSSCNSQGFIFVNIKRSEEPEAVAELAETDKSTFSPPIGLSDIQDMRNFLKNFSGDFASLFAEK